MIGVKIQGVGTVTPPKQEKSPEFAPLETTTDKPPEDVTKNGE